VLSSRAPAGPEVRLCVTLRGVESALADADGSYSLQRSSAYSSYAEDGCTRSTATTIALLKLASSAMADGPASPGSARVTLGGATGNQAFERSTKALSLIAGARRHRYSTATGTT
jgi:hypothetical protein